MSITPAVPRVLLLAPHFPPETIAGAVRLGSFARELSLLGHEILAVAPGDATAGDREGGARVMRVEVAPRGRGELANVVHQFALRRALRDGGLRALASGFRPDVVLVSSPPPVAALAGITVARAAGVPLALDVRDIWPDVLIEAGAVGEWSAAAGVLRIVERALMSAASLVTAATPLKATRLARRTSARVTVVLNGVDAAWSVAAPEYEGGEDFEVLYAGNIGRAQDLALLVQAAGPRRVTIVGDGEEREEVAALAQRRGGLVSLLPPEPRDRIRERLARCGCAFVSLRSAELQDAVPSKLLEAMARGVPVIAAVAGEAASIVIAADAGFVVPPGSAGLLADALARMEALTPDERRAMGRRGRAFVMAHHRREDAARALSEALHAVTGRTPRAR